MKTAAIWFGLSVLGIVGSWMAYNYMTDVWTRSHLSPPAQLEMLDRAALEEAAGLQFVESLSNNRHRVEVSLLENDRTAFLEHVSNIAVERGWLPHSFEFRSIKVIIPSEELPFFLSMKDRPYEWLQERRMTVDAGPQTVSWDTPAYVTIYAWHSGEVKMFLSCMMLLLAGGFTLFSAYVCVRYVMYARSSSNRRERQA